MASGSALHRLWPGAAAAGTSSRPPRRGDEQAARGRRDACPRHRAGRAGARPHVGRRAASSSAAAWRVTGSSSRRRSPPTSTPARRPRRSSRRLDLVSQRSGVLAGDVPVAAIGAALAGAGRRRAARSDGERLMEVVVAPPPTRPPRRAAAARCSPAASRGDRAPVARAGHRLLTARAVPRARRGPSSAATPTSRAAHGFALDEYVGLPPGHPESYREVLLREVCGALGLAPERLAVPDGSGHDVPTLMAAAASATRRAIRELGGVDVQVLGIGANGHLGFNEPGSALTSRTRVKRLSDRTRRDNARFFRRHRRRADPLRHPGPRHDPRARAGWCSSRSATPRRRRWRPRSRARSRHPCPASVLQWHPDTVVCLDEAAAAGAAQPAVLRRRGERPARLTAPGYGRAGW